MTRAPFDTLLLIGVILLAAAGSHLLGASGAGRPRRRLAALRGGARAGEDPAGIFLRRVLHGTHIAVVGTVLVMAWTLLEVGRTDGETSGEDGVVVMAARGDPGTDWGPILQELGALAGVQAESLAAPGALQGLGIRDMVITECGACSRGGLPSPLWNARADHHAVGPGFFDLTGQRVVQGRPFSRLDGRNARRVALINEELANTAFEGGRPLGKKIRVGSDFDAWYTVIGVVAEETPPALGRDGHRRSAVYLNALQHPLGSARVLVRGGEDGVRAARALLAREGLAPGEPLPTGAFLRAEAGPLVWGLALARALGGLTLLLAVHGIGVATLQSARRRARDVAVRRAVGASTGAILRHTLTETLRTTGWGLAGFAFFATLTVALLESSTGLEGPGPGAWSVLAGGLVALSVLASARAALEATRVQPGTLLK